MRSNYYEYDVLIRIEHEKKHRKRVRTDQGAWQPSPTWDICARAEPVLSARHSCVSCAVADPGSQPNVHGFSNWGISQESKVMSVLGGNMRRKA